MKKESISVSLNAERLRAIKKYMEKKDVDLEEELVEQLEKLYSKYVPVNVREYIDEKKEEENKARKPKRTAKGTNIGNSASTTQE